MAFKFSLLSLERTKDCEEEKTMAKKTNGRKKQQEKFSRSAKKCAKKKGNFQACMKKELKKK